jgi:hypothetical protein
VSVVLRITLICITVISAMAVTVLLGAVGSGTGLRPDLGIFFFGVLGYLVLAPRTIRPVLLVVGVIAAFGSVLGGGMIYRGVVNGQSPLPNSALQAGVALGVVAGIVARVGFRFIALLGSGSLVVLYVRYHDAHLLAVAALIVACIFVVLYSHVLFRAPRPEMRNARGRRNSSGRGGETGGGRQSDGTQGERRAGSNIGGSDRTPSHRYDTSREMPPPPAETPQLSSEIASASRGEDNEETGGLAPELGVGAVLQQAMQTHFWILLLLFQTVIAILGIVLLFVEYRAVIHDYLKEIFAVSASFCVWISILVITWRRFVRSDERFRPRMSGAKEI